MNVFVVSKWAYYIWTAFQPFVVVQVFVVRQDLKMGGGKIASQCARKIHTLLWRLWCFQLILTYLVLTCLFFLYGVCLWFVDRTKRLQGPLRWHLHITDGFWNRDCSRQCSIDCQKCSYSQVNRSRYILRCTFLHILIRIIILGTDGVKLAHILQMQPLVYTMSYLAEMEPCWKDGKIVDNQKSL